MVTIKIVQLKLLPFEMEIILLFYIKAYVDHCVKKFDFCVKNNLFSTPKIICFLHQKSL